jgi:hypothetical protein
VSLPVVQCGVLGVINEIWDFPTFFRNYQQKMRLVSTFFSTYQQKKGTYRQFDKIQQFLLFHRPPYTSLRTTTFHLLSPAFNEKPCTKSAGSNPQFNSKLHCLQHLKLRFYQFVVIAFLFHEFIMIAGFFDFAVFEYKDVV